eukprot:gb/GEZN01008773.1/.p1 GENE.gb/GEZN01008773.1/~~gb/GEZN01008773.1/.p1  ORF type:complete len:250 (-),score=19.25 gb/GEZN01008773.1/:644-1360(-)
MNTTEQTHLIQEGHGQQPKAGGGLVVKLVGAAMFLALTLSLNAFLTWAIIDRFMATVGSQSVNENQMLSVASGGKGKGSANNKVSKGSSDVICSYFYNVSEWKRFDSLYTPTINPSPPSFASSFITVASVKDANGKEVGKGMTTTSGFFDGGFGGTAEYFQEYVTLYFFDDQKSTFSVQLNEVSKPGLGPEMTYKLPNVDGTGVFKGLDGEIEITWNYNLPPKIAVISFPQFNGKCPV